MSDNGDLSALAERALLLKRSTLKLLQEQAEATNDHNNNLSNAENSNSAVSAENNNNGGPLTPNRPIPGSRAVGFSNNFTFEKWLREVDLGNPNNHPSPTSGLTSKFPGAGTEIDEDEEAFIIWTGPDSDDWMDKHEALLPEELLKEVASAGKENMRRLVKLAEKTGVVFAHLKDGTDPLTSEVKVKLLRGMLEAKNSKNMEAGSAEDKGKVSGSIALRRALSKSTRKSLLIQTNLKKAILQGEDDDINRIKLFVIEEMHGNFNTTERSFTIDELLEIRKKGHYHGKDVLAMLQGLAEMDDEEKSRSVKPLLNHTGTERAFVKFRPSQLFTYSNSSVRKLPYGHERVQTVDEAQTVPLPSSPGLSSKAGKLLKSPSSLSPAEASIHFAPQNDTQNLSALANDGSGPTGSAENGLTNPELGEFASPPSTPLLIPPAPRLLPAQPAYEISQVHRVWRNTSRRGLGMRIMEFHASNPRPVEYNGDEAFYVDRLHRGDDSQLEYATSAAPSSNPELLRDGAEEPKNWSMLPGTYLRMAFPEGTPGLDWEPVLGAYMGLDGANDDPPPALPPNASSTSDLFGRPLAYVGPYANTVPESATSSELSLAVIRETNDEEEEEDSDDDSDTSTIKAGSSETTTITSNENSRTNSSGDPEVPELGAAVGNAGLTLDGAIQALLLVFPNHVPGQVLELLHGTGIGLQPMFESSADTDNAAPSASTSVTANDDDDDDDDDDDAEAAAATASVPGDQQLDSAANTADQAAVASVVDATTARYLGAVILGASERVLHFRRAFRNILEQREAEAEETSSRAAELEVERLRTMLAVALHREEGLVSALRQYQDVESDARMDMIRDELDRQTSLGHVHGGAAGHGGV